MPQVERIFADLICADPPNQRDPWSIPDEN